MVLSVDVNVTYTATEREYFFPSYETMKVCQDVNDTYNLAEPFLFFLFPLSLADDANCLHFREENRES